MNEPDWFARTLGAIGAVTGVAALARQFWNDWRQRQRDREIDDPVVEVRKLNAANRSALKVTVRNTRASTITVDTVKIVSPGGAKIVQLAGRSAGRKIQWHQVGEPAARADLVRTVAPAGGDQKNVFQTQFEVIDDAGSGGRPEIEVAISWQHPQPRRRVFIRSL